MASDSVKLIWMLDNRLLKKIIPDGVWSWVREKKILKQHRKVASICKDFICQSTGKTSGFSYTPKAFVGKDRIIWQYWGTGFENVPGIVRECLKSVDEYCDGYRVIRLSDGNLRDYIDIPDWFESKRCNMSAAHFSDVLRLCLLSVYGGVWMDATIMLTGVIPHSILSSSFFMFQRDPDEENKSYWRNVYAYYYGWAKGFRVNCLNSFIVSSFGNADVRLLCELMLLWWKEHDALPDYFFFQILYDTLLEIGMIQRCDLSGDCKVHLLQQYMNDPSFSLMRKEDILRCTTIHKLTYKVEK